MSKKKPKKKHRKSHKSPKTKSNQSAPIMDRRIMDKIMSDMGKLLSQQNFASVDEANAFLQQLLNSGKPIPPTPASTPLEQAQDLIYEALEASGKQRVELARKAIQISPDCADAYVILAEETTKSPTEAKELYEQGVKAGERVIGPEAFEEDVGHFWGLLETRPYMRARLGLVQCLWTLSEKQQAIEHYKDMLRLNPGDNQGIRYILVNCLLEEGLDEEVGELLEQYEDDAMSCWLYSRALWMFRKEGASINANACLEEALEHNKFVPAYLLGKKSLPRHLPDYIGFGDENEAIEYAVEAMKIWLKTPGALEWLVRNLYKV